MNSDFQNIAIGVDIGGSHITAVAVDMTANRIISGSPQLMLEEGRLIREVEVNQRLFLELKAQRELAGIERYRDVPLVIVLDEAATPVTRFAPRRARLLVSGFVVFFLCGSLWILAGESRRSRAVPTGKDS